MLSAKAITSTNAANSGYGPDTSLTKNAALESMPPAANSIMPSNEDFTRPNRTVKVMTFIDLSPK